MRTPKTLFGLAVIGLILSGCGGGSGSSSAPASGTSNGSATLKWTAPTMNSDGSALTDLAGYHVYYGASATAMSNTVDITNPTTLIYVVTGLSTGTWYFAVTAYTNTGLQSPMSNIASKTIR